VVSIVIVIVIVVVVVSAVVVISGAVAIMVVVVVTVPTLIMVLMARRILAGVPIVANKIHGPAARVIFRAMSCPMPFLSRRHMQVHRLIDESAIAADHYGPGVDQGGRSWHLADIDLPEQPRLTDIDGDADIRSESRYRNNRSGDTYACQ